MHNVLINKNNNKYSRPKFYAHATLLSPGVCCKHYISMYLDEHLKKTLVFCENIGYKIPHPLNFKALELICNIFQEYSCVRCSECQVSIKEQNYCCQFYVIVAIDSQNLHRLNRKLFEAICFNTIELTE